MRRSTGRPRDSKGKFISSSKFPETFGLVNIPILIAANRYAGLRQEGGSVDTNLVSNQEFLDEGEKTIRQVVFDNPVEEPVEMQDNVDEKSTNINRVPIPLVHMIIKKPFRVPIADMDHQDGRTDTTKNTKKREKASMQW